MRHDWWKGVAAGALCGAGAVACTGKERRMAETADERGVEPGAETGFEPVFECGELDIYDAYVLVQLHRVYEVACGEMPAGTRDGDTPWDVLAAQYRLDEQCEAGGTARAPDWRYYQDNPCAVEAVVNARVHGFRVAGCPEWEYGDHSVPSANFNITWFQLWSQTRGTLNDACSPPDPN
jgi:hypothetical protein